MLSVTFNLWLDDRPSCPHTSFLLLAYAFFSSTNNHALLSILNTIQPPTTNSATTTLSLSIFMFWFKSYWGFFTLIKQIYPFLSELNFKMLIFVLYIFIEYVFCLDVYLFYSFFSYKFVVWIYDLYMLGLF